MSNPAAAMQYANDPDIQRIMAKFQGMGGMGAMGAMGGTATGSSAGSAGGSTIKHPTTSAQLDQILSQVPAGYT